MQINTIETFEAMQDRIIAQRLIAERKRRAYMKRDTFSAAMRKANEKRTVRARVARFFGL